MEASSEIVDTATSTYLREYSLKTPNFHSCKCQSTYPYWRTLLLLL